MKISITPIVRPDAPTSIEMKNDAGTTLTITSEHGYDAEQASDEQKEMWVKFCEATRYGVSIFEGDVDVKDHIGWSMTMFNGVTFALSNNRELAGKSVDDDGLYVLRNGRARKAVNDQEEGRWFNGDDSFYIFLDDVPFARMSPSKDFVPTRYDECKGSAEYLFAKEGGIFDDRSSEAGWAAEKVLDAAGCSQANAKAEYDLQKEAGLSDANMSGSGAIWAEATLEAHRVYTKNWHSPERAMCVLLVEDGNS